MAQVNDNDDIKWLYGKLKAKGYNIGSEAEFKSSLANGEDRKWYYEKAKGMGLDMGSMDDFESMYAPKAAPAPKRETPSSGQRKPASAVSASPEQPKKQKPKGTPMTEQDKIRMSLQMGQMKQQVQQGIANTNAKIGRMMEPLTQKGRERRRLGEFQARMAGTPTHVVGFNTAAPAPAGSGARGGSRQKPVQSEQSPQPYGVKYENGKAKTQWVLPDGTLTTSLIEANQAEYEARTARLAHQFQNRMKENGLDPNKPEDVRKQAQLDYEAPMRKAIEDEWQRAEAEDRAADEAYRKDMERAEGGSFWDRLKKSITPLGPDGMPLRRGDETLRDIKRAAKRQDTFNLEKIAQSVLQNMPQEYKDNQMLNYSRYFREHPSELKGRTVSQAAKEALQGEVYHATYERAVQARMPKSKTEFLLRKVADQPFFSQTMADNMAARLFSHSIGTEAADMDAMGRYGTDHRALDITGTVLNMAIDPTTYISGGVGSFAGKQALKLSGMMALKGASKEAAERYIGRTLAGRMVAGVAAGSANFGTFEGLKNMQQQMRLGGTLNPETGEYEFSAGDMLKATGHGMLLGSVTGTLSPVLGNVSDKLVKATESTAGKVGIRAGELMTSTVAEGTIFATPEWIENAQLADDDPRKRKAMDIWTDNMAMMLGFKVSHGIKSAPQVIAGLRPIAEPKTMEERNHNRRSFAERLRKRMDASPRDLDFTKEEREELRRNGYGDLASLFTRTPKQPTKPKAKPTMTDGKTMTFDVDYQHADAERVSNPEFDGYEAMERLMQDPNVSQSARAKAYYILTGRMLPMGTVTGYTTNKDANGVTVQAITAQGEVVTSRHFKTEEEAKKEESNIMRQAELNSVDVGERYKEAAANAKVVQAAVESVAPGADFATVMRNYKAVKEGDKDAIAAYGKMVEDIDRAIEANKSMADYERPEAIRASIKEETGVDVDATLRKEPKNRTEEEQAAVEDYIKRLFPEQKSEEAGASAEAEQPMSEAESAAAAVYDQARLLWDKVEKGDADAKAEVDAITLRMQEAYQMCEDAFGADAEMRIAEINEDPWPLVNNPELSEDQQDAVLYYVNAKAAMEGVMDASNEAADGKRKEVEANVKRHTHKDMGVVQPATMKVDDKPVYVVKGNVVMLPDGSGIDVRNSDQSIVICDAETGEYKFASPDQLFSLGEAIDPQTELDEAYANIQAEHEAVLGVPENGENVQGNGENVPQLTDEQLQQYAHSAFNEATQSNGITIPQEQAEQLQQRNQQMLEQEQQRKEEEANRQPTALERVPINEETGEPMFEKADRETALDALNEITGGNDENTTAIVRAQVEQATKALEALKKKEPTKKAPSLKGSPMAMVKAQQEAEANYNTAMEEYNAQVAAAEENLNAWSRINSLMNDRKRAIREQQEAERKVREEKLHAEAVARLEEDKRIAAEKAAEQEAVGTHAVNPKIKAKWDGATKVEGNPNAITLADGSTIRGHYVLTEAGAATASHDVNNAYEPTEGFPVDENGESVNDRDYKRDKDAQRIVRDMADSYDSRALQTPVIVSKDGVVLSGNNRTMSGDIAAQQGTDKAYIDHLREFGQMYGFTPEQIDGMKHPRVVFVPDEHLPYDATTFARFNAEQQKKQSKPEHAVKLGKIVPDNVFTSITNDISRFDRLSDYYADDKAVSSAISQLLGAGVINEMQLPEMRTGNSLSAAGKELIENTLIGKVFQTSPDAVRHIISTPTLRQSVIMGLNEIAHNRTLAKSGYDLSKELGAAVDLVARAKSAHPDIFKDGMPVSPFGREQGLFDDEYGDSRVTDGTVLMLADILNSGKPSDLRKVLSTYNSAAVAPAGGQLDMFTGDVRSKEQILNDVNELFRNATPREQQALVDAAIAERKRIAETEAGQRGGNKATEQTEDAVQRSAEPQQSAVAETEPAKQDNTPQAEEPIEPEKPKYEVSDEEMNGLMNDIRDILGIGDDEGDAGFKFRDPDELTAEQRQKLMSVGQRLAMAMVERGNESFGDYASMMVKALGDKVRPWLKAFYGGLEYVPGYDKYALTPYEEVKAFDVENFDKPTKDVMAQANMIVEEGKAQVTAEKANNELKATRNEQRKETEKQTAANTDAVAAEAKSVASEATALAETSSDEQALTGAAERVDETLDKVNEQLALLGYYEADEVEKDYNEAYGYIRNAEKKAVKDASNLASQLISDLNLSHYEASHSKQTDKKGNRKKKPLAVSNISPIGGDVSIHLPLEEGRELYLTIGVEPRAAKGVDGFGGSDLEVTHIMFRVDHPEGTGNDRYGRNVFVDSNVTYSDLLKQVQREAYKYLIGSGVTNEGEYAAGDKVQYSTDGGRTWTDAVVVQPNDEGGIRIDTGLAPVMWVNAHPEQLRHKPSESAEPKHEAVGDFYEDGINEDAVAALPEDTAIQLHVVDILNPGMTDHSMKSKIESLNTLLPKISDKKLSELDKEYGDDKDMGTHIKAEVARRAKDGGVQPTSSEKPADKPKPASKKNATKKVKPEQPVGDLFAGLFDEPNNNETADSNSSSPSQTVAGAERPDTVGIDETGTDGAERTTAVAGTDGERSTDASRENGREAADGAVHGTDEVGGIQPPVGNRGRDESTADGTVSNGATDERGRVAGPRTVQTGEIDGGGKELSSGEPASSTGEGSRPSAVKKQRTPVRKFTNNFHYGTDGNEADNYTPAQRLEGNVSAIEVIAKLFKEGRKATDEEKQILSRFRGWGQIDQLSKFYSVDQMRRDTYGNSPYRRLANAIDTLDPDGKKGVFAGIKRAALSSYYTPTKIASAMNSFLSLAGFKGGTFLDPSMGNGIFEGTLPKDIQERTMITGVELDWLSGQISRALYPDADVRICGFEKSELTPNSQDVVTSNVPFGDIEVNDPTWKNDNSPVKRSAQKRIHNYYAVKMLELTRPGGIVAMMTSPAVMDTQSNQHIRRYIAEQGEFLGAVRLPDNTFQGTGAMADIIYIRKWKDEEDAQKTRENPDYVAREQAFLSSAETTAPNKRNGEKQKVSHNAYYASNRKNMIGDVVAGNQYNDKSFGLHSELTTDQIAKEVEKAVKRIVGDRKGMLFDTTRTSREVKQAVREEYKGDGNWVSTGNLVIQDGKVGVLTATKNEYGEVTRVFEEQPQLAKQKKRIIAMGEVRTAMKELIAGQIDGLSDTKLNMLRAKLKRAYEEFVSKYGKLQDTDNAVVLSDIDGYTLQALEVWKGGKFQGLSDIFTKNTIKPALKLEDAKTPQEAITTSLAEYGEIRGEYIEKALGADWFEQCGDLVFKEPNATDRYVTRDEYLSGDVVAKLEEAKTAAATDPTFERNVKELEQVQPATIPFDDITIHLGARWIPQEVLNDFVKETLGLHASSSRNYEWVDGERREIIKSGVVYVPETDTFEINIEAKELGGQADDWETADKSVKEIFQAALEDKDFRIVRKDKDGNTWIDQEATELANSKVADLREHFEQWLPGDDARVQTMERAYNDRFNRIVLRKWDGSHLNVPGLMGKELRPHQKDAVWMLINNRGGIVDHIVGAGKTLVMQSAIMEMRRMGIAKKPMIVALKSTVPQIAREFKEAYPTARVLAPSEKDFSTENRKKFFANISLNDYDCIIVSHEQYCKIPHSEEAEGDVVNEQLAQLDAMIEYLYGTGDKSQLTKRQIKSLEKRRQNLHAKLEKRLDRSTDREFCFENMGIDYLFVDECHQFKSLPYVTSYQNVAGLGEASGSNKAVALLTGIRHLQKMHQGDKGTVFLSGTTITNSLVEIYNLLNYLRPRKLEQLGMPTFDAWASTFAVHSSELEAGVSNEFKMKDRFRYFDNVPELSQLYAEIADVRNDYNLQLPKPKVDGKTVIVPQSDAVAEINREVVNMLQTKDGSYFGIHPKDPKKFPWGLVASGISAKAAVSPRLVFPEMDDSVGKISYCCDNIKKSYDEMKEQKGVQLVFCELGVPTKGKEYDAYHDIINRLTKDYGIPREEIAYIQQVKNDKEKEALFQKVRDGKVRILIGGTRNMGTGVNVQTRITDLHMLTVPWQPADLEQCIGRGSRQGNVVAHDFLDNKVRVHYYATEGSLDLYKYQLLDAKGKMFTQFKMGTISGERSFDEGDADENGNIDPAQMVALLSGNPIIFEKSKQDKLVKKLKSLYNGFLRDQQRKRQNYETVTKKVDNLKRLISLSDSDVHDLQREGFKPDEKGTYPSKVKVCIEGSYYGQDFDKPKEAGQYILEQLKNNKKVVLAGFGQRADVVFVTGDDLLSSHYEVQLGGNNAWSIRYTKRMPQDPTQAGLVFRSLLEQIIHNNEVYHREYDTNSEMLKTMPKGDAPFPKQKELDEAITKQKELDAEYNELGQSEEDKTKFRLLDADDPKAMELESLPESDLVPVYRNVQAFEDDALGSPMAFTDAETGERRTLEGRSWNYSAPPKVELTEEQQRKLDELNKNGYIMVDGKKSTELQINDGLKFVKPKTKEAQLQYFLKKNPEDKGLWAAYDPYDHAIETPLNTQFGEAYKRPNLVVVRSLIPKSEIDEPFHADYALLPTGAHQWNNGRTLYLSRWSKIDKVLTREEEAKLIDEYWKRHPGKREELKTHRDYNRFVPQVRRELEKMGYRFELDGKELTPEESLALDKQNWESRDVIPGREGHTPFVSNEDIARINAKMAGKWVGEPKEAMESAMSERVTELSERLHTPVRIIRTEEEVAALPSVRQRRMKGSFNPMTGEVTIVVPNNANMADIENTFVHEVVGHDGLRVLFPDEAKLNNALDELYRVSKEEIRGTIDRMAQKMYDAEVDRIREKKRKEHEARGEDANASYYADMAAAHAEAGKKREQFKRDATEEYGADLAGRIGEKGFEKMSAEELTFWGKLKAMLQKALQKLLNGLKIPGKRKWGDKDWAFVLHEAYKRKKNGGKPTVFDAADTEVMRRKTGFGDTKFSDGYKKSAQPNEAALKHLEPIDVEHAAKDNHSPETDPYGGIMFRDGDMGLEETITKMKVEASQANADNWQAKQDAMRAIGGNLNKLRQAMARQRAYDLSTVKSITDLAKVLLENGLLDDLSKYETKRILSAVNNVHGKQDVSDYVQKVMDIMVDNQLRMGANQLGKLLSIRGSRVDARGIEVQGQLDPEGQRIAQVVRKAASLPKENIEERIADCTNRMSSDDNAVAEEAAIEYSGLLLAHQFVEDITESKAEEKALRESIKEAKADLDAGTMEADAYREYVESTNDAIRQNKIERAEAYRSIVEQVGGVLGGSVERAKAWREAEKQRVETIHHNANSDMTGRPNDEHHKESKAQKIANNSIVRFVLAPLGTFDQMLRMFGKKSVNGEGYLWNRYMRGWVEATEKEYTGYQNALKTLDEKVSEVFDKKMKWGDLFSLERNLPKATVTFWDGGEQKAHELTQGNLLYIYMVDKMADGRMKLRRMGITEEDVENIKEFVDPRFLELADWMQDEFLVEKRNEYNEVHKRMFGASMAAIENYFPLKILANARIEEVDVADDTTDTALPATSTGSIIKRRRNNLALDVMGADAFSVILDHIQQMERWASFAEFNRDLNTLLSYKRFRNQVMNMTSVYGGGKTLWKNFRNVCSMAAGAYRPPIAALDKAAVNVAKGVTAAKVSFRVFTALKQFLSMPAYLSDSSPVYLAGNIANPIGAWKWSMENLPLFEKRWKSRMAGDPRLMKSEMDWKMWQNRAVEIASRIGMSPNAFVDALTVAIGAHSMYQTKKKKYLRYGYDEETAEKRAKQDATILFNQTQQSSESAFLSTMQTDRSWLSVLFTVFRNSSMSYTRQLYDALRNLKHRFEPGYKGLTEEYLAKQMRRDGIDPDKADQNAKSEYRRSLMRDIVRVGVFGYLLQFAWNLGAYLPYLLLGDDKDEKSDMWHDIFCHTMFGSIEGLTGGDVMSAVGNGFAKGEGLNLFSASKDMPLSSDLQNIVNKWNKDKVAAMNDVTNLMVQSGIGVNPQSLTDAVVAIMDYCGDDANTSRECALLITRIINCPQSQIDKIYFDELNATAAEAQGMTPAEIAERYARYKMHRGAPLTGWAYTDEARDSVMTAQQNRVLTKAKEKLNSRMETEETKQLLSDYDAVAKQETALSKIKKTDRAAYREGMKQLRQSNDMRLHMRLKRYKHDMNELTSKYLRCKSAEERDSIVSTMFSTRAKMLEDIGRLKQQ